VRLLLLLISSLIVGCASEPNKKLYQYSEAYIGKKYSRGPLGEGPDGLVDKDPLVRFDKFDCTTYIETVLAQSLGENFDKALLDIRYSDGKPSYATRNHFISADWIPNNTRKGYVRDITESVVKKGNVKYVKLEIDRQQWVRKKRMNSKVKKIVLDSIGEKELVSLPYFSFTELLKTDVLEQLPNEMIFNIVHVSVNKKKKIGTDIAIVHQGFLIKDSTSGEYIVRHASDARPYKVVEESANTYFQRKANINYISRQVGVNLLEIRKP